MRFLGALTFLILILAVDLRPVQSSSAWWVWPGMSYRQLPQQADLYVLQGRFELGRSGHSSFVPLGLSPHPLRRAGKLYLVYRFDHLASVHQVAGVFAHQQRAWATHGTEVGGIQLDFDSPTRALPEYAEHVRKLRKLLGPEIQLSITGLGDWLRDDRGTLHALANSVDFVAFQLYAGRRPIANLPVYYKRLAALDIPFKVGVLDRGSTQTLPVSVIQNPSFIGRIIFRIR